MFLFLSILHVKDDQLHFLYHRCSSDKVYYYDLSLCGLWSVSGELGASCPSIPRGPSPHGPHWCSTITTSRNESEPRSKPSVGNIPRAPTCHLSVAAGCGERGGDARARRLSITVNNVISGVTHPPRRRPLLLLSARGAGGGGGGGRDCGAGAPLQLREGTVKFGGGGGGGEGGRWSTAPRSVFLHHFNRHCFVSLTGHGIPPGATRRLTPARVRGKRQVPLKLTNRSRGSLLCGAVDARVAALCGSLFGVVEVEGRGGKFAATIPSAGGCNADVSYSETSPSQVSSAAAGAWPRVVVPPTRRYPAGGSVSAGCLARPRSEHCQRTQTCG